MTNNINLNSSVASSFNLGEKDLQSSGKIKILGTLILIAITSLNTACTVVGPDYVRPSMNVPAIYKQAPDLTAPELVNQASNDQWWLIYADANLNQLMTQIEFQNYSLQATTARMHQARSLADIAQARKSPTVFAGGKNDLGILLGWEVDLWGRVQRNLEASNATAQASLADLAATKLLLQAQLAQNYFRLRVQDAEIHLLQNTVVSYQRSLQITNNQYEVGVAAQGDIAQAQAQLSNAQVLMLNAQVTRAQLEHSIAVLMGKAPTDFAIAIAPIEVTVPEIPAQLPSELLLRRPDIAAAERRMAAASAQIGVAQAEAYPSLSIAIGASIAKGVIGGSDLVAPIYTAGATKGSRTQAEAAYEEVVANYRQTILNGFLEVEDNLVALQILKQASMAQAEALTSTRKVVEIMNNQYRAGVVNYQSIIIAQATSLISERSALSLLGRRLVASVALIKALGGGWDSSELEEIKAPQEAAETSDK